MSASTTRLSLTKPGGGSTGTITPGEIVDIDVLNANFDKIDAAVGAALVSSTTRPATPYSGQLGKESDTGSTVVWDGTQWQLVGVIPRRSQEFPFVNASAPGGTSVVVYQTVPTQAFTQRLIVEADGHAGANSAGGNFATQMKFKGTGVNVIHDGVTVTGAAANAETMTASDVAHRSTFAASTYAPLRDKYYIDIPAGTSFQWSLVTDSSTTVAYNVTVEAKILVQGEFA